MNIVRYVRQTKATFDELPFNEVDSLILCELSYLQFDRSVCGRPAKTMGQLCQNIDALVADTLLPKDNVKLLKEVATSPRFAPVKVGYFRQCNSARREIRFAAMTFELTENLHYIAYRGTDITLLGWKEDFNMALLKTIPSQRLALNYLQKFAPLLQGRLLMGGHSKGGNLVVYAAVYAPDELRNRIDGVYDHDGPGFKQDIFGDPRYLQLQPRIHKTVPHDSIIGMLLNTMQQYEVVESDSISVMQHNPFSWVITEQNAFKKLPQTARTSQATELALTSWIASLDRPTTKKLVDALFTVVYGSGATTVPQLTDHVLVHLHKMKQAFHTLDEDSRNLLLGNGKELIKLWFDSMRHVRKGAQPALSPDTTL